MVPCASGRGRLWIAAGLMVAIAGAPPAAAAPGWGRTAARVRQCANRERAKHGLGPLADNAVLDAAAQLHARNMAHYNFFDHDDPWGRGPGQRIDKCGSAAAFRGYGENIAAGETSPAQACRDWMASPGHRENILDPTFHSVGGGFAAGDTEYHFYYVQEFGEANPGAPPRSHAHTGRPGGPVVEVRLSDARDRLTLELNGHRLLTIGPRQRRYVELGRLGPRARVTVEARSTSGTATWGIEERSGGRTVYRDSGSDRGGSATTPLVRRLTLDARGHVLALRRRPLPLELVTPAWGAGLIARWR